MKDECEHDLEKSGTCEWHSALKHAVVQQDILTCKKCGQNVESEIREKKKNGQVEDSGDT